MCKIWGFHGGDYEESRLLGCDAMYVSPPSSLSVYRRLLTLVHRLRFLYTLKMEAIRS
jgi:hypothetical protein